MFSNCMRRFWIGLCVEVVDIDIMQHGFIPGRGTVDAVFVLRRLTQKIRNQN